MIKVSVYILIIAVAVSCSKSNGTQTGSSTTTTTPPPAPAAKTPDQVLDLSHWTLTIPIDASNGTTGKAVTITTASLLAGYTSSYFYVSADTGVVFWSPVNGATTSGSTHPRSELREVLKPTDNSVDWYWNTPSKLSAVLAVNEVPTDTGKVVVGQIHGYSVDVPMVLIFYNYNTTTKTATVYAGVHNASDTQAKDYTLATNIALNQRFSYELDVTAQAKLNMYVNNATPVVVSIDSSWNGASLYYKAGNYVQDHGSSLTDGGQVTFYQLSASHN